MKRPGILVGTLSRCGLSPRVVLLHQRHVRQTVHHVYQYSPVSLRGKVAAERTCIHWLKRFRKVTVATAASHCACSHCSSLRWSAPHSSHSFHMQELEATGLELLTRQRCGLAPAPRATQPLATPRMSHADEVRDGWQRPQFSAGTCILL